MSHEIYYTSAPEGLKRGTSGFCTVAASEAIPRALWDRLESLSAYRHQFSMNSSDSAAPLAGNPVSHAHWILSVTGKTYHVLSRVCDSGVNHTQRTNAFAHHLVLESAEMEAAFGGPAWMLEQHGVMAERWDGNVGPLTRARLPKGDIFSSSRICQSWTNAGIDAGWGGHLADAFVKNPSRPVCILFKPGQELLPLLAEAIALLPPATRWNVTFNTYFTSMPTSATCLWRCCLAGTPAAQVGLRYAASGLTIDLTDPRRLGEPPAGAYVTMARTGEPVEVPARPAAPARLSHMPQPLKPATKSAPIVDPDDDEEEELERRRAAVFEAAGEKETAGAHDAGPSMAEASRAAEAAGEYDIAPVGPTAAQIAAAHAAERSRRGSKPEPSIRRAERALLEAEEESQHGARRRRQQVMWLFCGALAAIAAGTGAVWLAYHNIAPPEDPPNHQAHQVEPPTTPDHVEPAPPEPVSPHVAQVPDVIVNPESPPIPLPVPSTTIQSTVLTPAVYPAVITPLTAIERPNIGNGIGDRLQSLTIRGTDFDKSPISGLRIHFPAIKAGRGAAPPPTANVYVSDALGTLSAVTETRASKPGVALRYKTQADPAPPTEVAFISFDRTRLALDLQWRSGPLMRHPQLLPFAFWILQNSKIELESAREKSQQIAFKAYEPAPLSLADPDFTFSWPVELPSEAAVVPPRLTELPRGWEASWYTDWEVKETALRSPANAFQVLKFKKPTTTAAIDAWFLITFKPTLDKAESTFPKRLAADQADLAKFQSELRALDQQIADAKAREGEAAMNSTGGQDLLRRQSETTKLVAAYQAAVDAYRELSSFYVAFDLPDGLRLATLRFQQPKPTETGK